MDSTLCSWSFTATSGKRNSRSAMKAASIAFRPTQEADLPLLHRWFNTPHVSAWWSVSGYYRPSVEVVKNKYLPRLRGIEPVDCYIINIDGLPAGMVQSCKFDDFPEEKTEFGLENKCAGIDIMIGEEAYVHRGLGSPIIRQFLKEVIFIKYDVDRCVVDPYPENEIAIKAYKKAGFRYLKTVFYREDDRKEDILVIDRDEIN
jgi:RimJ/RimL family protein N-acetyltransferase